MYRLAILNTMLLAIMVCGVLEGGNGHCVNESIAAPSIASASEIVWQKDYKKCLTQASKSRKWVLVDVYTDWCGWCKTLDSTTYKNSNVIKYLRANFFCLKINGDDPGLGKWANQTFHISGYPTILILFPDGKLKGQIVGYVGPNLLLQKITAMFR